MNTPAQEVLQQARAKYDRATHAFREQKHNGGITELDPMDPGESDDLAAGARLKARTPVGVTVFGVWQKCKAELDAAANNVRREQGQAGCPTCPGKAPMGEREMPVPMPDSRLPRERDEEGEGLL